MKNTTNLENSVKIVTWNVNGIRSRIFNNKICSQIPKKKNYYAEEGSSIINLINETNADIICLQETRCDVENGSYAILNNYHSYFNESKLTNARAPNRYSGTAVYSKIIPNKIEYSIPGYEDNEGRIIILYYNSYILVNVYVPNSGTNYENRKLFNDAFLEYFKTINIPIVFCGDMNVAVDTYFDKTTVKEMPGIYKHELKFFNDITCTNTYGGMFKDTLDTSIDNTIYTWWNPMSKKILNIKTNVLTGMQRYENKGWRIDYILIRGFIHGKSKVLKHIGEEYSPHASDHAPVFAELIY